MSDAFYLRCFYKKDRSGKMISCPKEESEVEMIKFGGQSMSFEVDHSRPDPFHKSQRFRRFIETAYRLGKTDHASQIRRLIEFGKH